MGGLPFGKGLMGMTLKQLTAELGKELYDRKNFEVLVALPNGEQVGIDNVSLDYGAKVAWLNADTLGPTDEDSDYLPSETQAFDS
jgi:hypothetical protein